MPASTCVWHAPDVLPVPVGKGHRELRAVRTGEPIGIRLAVVSVRTPTACIRRVDTLAAVSTVAVASGDRVTPPDRANRVGSFVHIGCRDFDSRPSIEVADRVVGAGECEGVGLEARLAELL
jgi:hypothetical protein